MNLGAFDLRCGLTPYLARKEFSDRWYFHNYDDIQVAMDDWLLDYNRYRPHGSLGLMTHDEFAGKPVDRRAHL